MNDIFFRVIAIALGAAAIVAAPPTHAADLPIKALPEPAGASWSGFYLGLGAGFRTTQARGELKSASATSAGATTDLLAFCPIFSCALSEPLNGTAFRVSPYAGFNWQFASRWVAGIEADWGWADRTISLIGAKYPTTFANFGLAGAGLAGDSFDVKTTWDASVRARAGYLITPSFLVYATAGAAWLHLETTSHCNTATSSGGNFGIRALCGGAGLLNPSVISHATDRPGWTIGGGGEVALWSHWVARAEYRYADFGSFRAVDTQTCTAAGVGVTPCIAGGTQTAAYEVHVRTHVATFGLAYKFGDLIAPTQGTASPSIITKAAVAPLVSWTGLYAGVGFGLRANETSGTTSPYIPVPPGIVDPAAFCAAAACALRAPLNGVAFRVSPYAGVNWQLAPQWIVGIEGDAGSADRTVALLGVTYPSSLFSRSGYTADSFVVKTSWDASLRARAGYLVSPTVMLYATGGPAWLHVTSTSTCTTVSVGCGAGGFGPAVIEHTTTRFGATVGGGAEAMLWSHWVARAEYRYADFGKVGYTDSRLCAAVLCGVDTTVTVRYDLRLRTHTAMFGLAYKLDGFDPVIAKH